MSPDVIGVRSPVAGIGEQSFGSRKDTESNASAAAVPVLSTTWMPTKRRAWSSSSTTRVAVFPLTARQVTDRRCGGSVAGDSEERSSAGVLAAGTASNV